MRWVYAWDEEYEIAIYPLPVPSSSLRLLGCSTNILNCVLGLSIYFPFCSMARGRMRRLIGNIASAT